MLKVLLLKDLIFIVGMVGSLVQRLHVVTIVCEMVLDKQDKEIMGHVHLGLFKVNFSSLLSSDPPLVDGDAIFWPSKRPDAKKDSFSIAASAGEQLYLQSFLSSTHLILFYF